MPPFHRIGLSLHAIVSRRRVSSAAGRRRWHHRAPLACPLVLCSVSAEAGPMAHDFALGRDAFSGKQAIAAASTVIEASGARYAAQLE